MDRVYEHAWLIQAPATIWGGEESTGAGEKGGEEGRRKGTPQLSPSCPAAVTCKGPHGGAGLAAVRALPGLPVRTQLFRLYTGTAAACTQHRHRIHPQGTREAGRQSEGSCEGKGQAPDPSSTYERRGETGQQGSARVSQRAGVRISHFHALL